MHEQINLETYLVSMVTSYTTPAARQSALIVKLCTNVL